MTQADSQEETSSKIGVGDIVKDMGRCTVAKVVEVDEDDELLTLARPSGYSWSTDDHHCRPANERDLKEWDAASRLVAVMRGGDDR
ncbi:hypothetical protein [Streptomyces sp. WG-D5]